MLVKLLARSATILIGSLPFFNRVSKYLNPKLKSLAIIAFEKANVTSSSFFLVFEATKS